MWQLCDLVARLQFWLHIQVFVPHNRSSIKEVEIENRKDFDLSWNLPEFDIDFQSYEITKLNH